MLRDLFKFKVEVSTTVEVIALNPEQARGRAFDQVNAEPLDREDCTLSIESTRPLTERDKQIQEAVFGHGWWEVYGA